MSEVKTASRWVRFSGVLGAVIFIFGVIGALIVGSFTQEFLIFFHLLAGIILMAIWAVAVGLKDLGAAGEALTGRRARYSYNAALYIAVFVGLLVVINMAAYWRNVRWDLTEQGVYSLSPKSASLVKNLQKPLKLIAIDTPDTKDATKQLLDLYKEANMSKVSAEFVDPRTRPTEPDRLGMKPGNLLYIQYGEGETAPVSRLNEVNEQAVTNAIVKLTHGEAKKVYYVQGHGEPDLDSQEEDGAKMLNDALGDEHLSVASLLLLQTGSVPADAAAVILAAPKKALQQSEKDALTKYGDAGGRLILLANPEDRDNTDVRSIAEHYGITVGNDVVIDTMLSIFGPQLGARFMAKDYGTHEIVSQLPKQEPPVFSFASSVQGKASPGPKETYTEILKSGQSSWAEKNLALIFSSDSPSAEKEANDTAGPVSLGVVYEKKLDDGAAKKDSETESFEKAVRVIVVGDTSWIENGSFNMYSNRDLILNMVNWSIGEKGGITLRPKAMRNSSLAAIGQREYSMILAVSFLVPEFILLFGLIIWWRRRLVPASL